MKLPFFQCNGSFTLFVGTAANLLAIRAPLTADLVLAHD